MLVNNNLIILELINIGRIIFFFSIMLTIFYFLMLLIQKFQFYNYLTTIKFSKLFYLFLTLITSLSFIFLSFKFFFIYHNNFVVIANESHLVLNNKIPNAFIITPWQEYGEFFFFRNFLTYSISKFNLMFILLFSSLYPIISYLVLFDDNCYASRYYFHIQLIFSCSFLLVLTEHLLTFFFLYEVVVILTYSILNLSSNSRGNIEASLYFLGWAILGSIFVGFGILWLSLTLNSLFIYDISFLKLTHYELNGIYLLLAFGFGIKMSFWPFWYWLPKAHVEVSTGVSIFLSCIVIKLSYYCMLKFHISLPGEIFTFLIIFLGSLGVFDVLYRIINVRDLKSLIAHSSVLHTNLLIILTHTDAIHFGLNNILLYVWGHSLGTAGLFLCVYLIELRFGTRNITLLSGIWYSIPFLGYIIFWNLISFLEFPITIFFWGELWLWINLLNYMPLLGVELLFFFCCVFVCIFFKIWWGILFGVTAKNLLPVNFYISRHIFYWLIFLLILQLIAGVQPSIITSNFYV